VILLAGPTGQGHAGVVAIVGTGLIGAATVEALSRRASFQLSELPLDWNEPVLQGRQLAAIEEAIAAEAAAAAAGGRRPVLDVLWSAGLAGFAASPEQTSRELASFCAVLASAVRLAGDPNLAGARFHLVSSAGGLFEGQRQVDGRSTPAPRRPYGDLKLEQERLLTASGLDGRVYRLSSVYGSARPGQRIGLIWMLLVNGIRHRVTAINGRMDTLRDFVLVDDVADFLAGAILDHDARPIGSPVLLAHGRPSSIWEVQKLVESVVAHRVYVSYSLAPENSEDTTFATTGLPPRWHPSDLASNVRRMYREAVQSGTAFSTVTR